MRICHVITRLIIGGAQENTVLTCRGLAERGHAIMLAAGPETGPEGSLWHQAREAGCSAVTVESMRRAIRPMKEFATVRRLTALFREFKPDIVHTHSSKAGIVGRWAAARAGVPVVVHTIHGMSFNRTQPVLVRSVFRLLERRASRCTTHFVTVADAMIDQAVEAHIAPRERFTTIRSGMEVDCYAADSEARDRCRKAWGLAEDAIVVGTIARLFRNKGYEEIIEAIPRALSREPRLRFVWVGNGKHRSRYEEKLRAIGQRERVTFLGLIPPNEIGGVINGFDVLLHASRWEGLPRAVVQALLTEVPAVSFDNDGAPEVVIHGETGLLVPLGDSAGLVDAVVTLAQDAPTRAELGKRGRERCLIAFDWRLMVSELETLYQRLLSAANYSVLRNCVAESPLHPPLIRGERGGSRDTQ